MKPWSYPDASSLSGGIRVVGELPAPASSEEGKAAMAQALSTALTAAAQSPECRLRMILGEAYQRYLGLLQWFDTELARDEVRAPGLGALAEKFAGDTELLISGARPDQLASLAVQRNLLNDLMRERGAPKHEATTAITRVIEPAGCAEDCTHPSHQHVQV